MSKTVYHGDSDQTNPETPLSKYRQREAHASVPITAAPAPTRTFEQLLQELRNNPKVGDSWHVSSGDLRTIKNLNPLVVQFGENEVSQITGSTFGYSTMEAYVDSMSTYIHCITLMPRDLPAADPTIQDIINQRTKQAMEARYQLQRAMADMAGVTADDILHGRVELVEQHTGLTTSWHYRLRDNSHDVPLPPRPPKPPAPRPLPCVTAQEITTQDRRTVYGHPADDFKRAATLWSAYLGHEVTAEEVTMCMVLIKVSRLAHSPGHYDSLIDIAGYANCAGMIANREEEANKGAPK